MCESRLIMANSDIASPEWNEVGKMDCVVGLKIGILLCSFLDQIYCKNPKGELIHGCSSAT